MNALRRCVSWLSGFRDNSVAEPMRFSDLIRSLEMLGHCEAEWRRGAKRIEACPPYLARLPVAGPPRAVLTGARTPALVSTLEKAGAEIGGVRMSISNPDGCHSLLPSIVAFDADDETRLARVASLAVIRLLLQPPAWTLAHASASVREYLEALPWTCPSLGGDHFEYFDTSRVQFVPSVTDGEPVIVMRTKRDFVGRPIAAIRQGSRECPVESLEWPVQAALSEAGRSTVRYDARRRLFATAVGHFLPRLLARALCLSSGRVPRVSVFAGLRWTVFSEVPRSIAELVAEKIGQPVSESPVDV
jgi:hypothetical protein